MWINNNISKPLRKGYYKTLVDFDGLGNLIETGFDIFNGTYIVLTGNISVIGGRRKKITKQ